MLNNQRRIEILVGVFVLIALLCVGYLTIKLGELQLFNSNTYRLKARFSNVGGLGEGNAVRLSGVQVGRVDSIHLDKKRFAVIVTFSVQKDIKLSQGTMVSIKTSGLIGDKYLSISPGGSGIPLKPGDMIVDTQPPINIKDLISKYAFGEVGGGK